MIKRSTLYTIAVLAGIAALFFFMTAGTAREECRVCMDFRGRTNCATAAGPTQDAAVETARTTACGPITAGMNDVIACGNTRPASVQCRTR
jgi:hypothetical protein